MTVGIVTLYNSFNCGSFLQAYATQEFLKSEGIFPVFCKNKNRKKFTIRFLIAMKYFCLGNFNRAKHLLKVYKNFKKAQKHFKVTSNMKILDTVIYGSDTIWYYQTDYFKNNWSHFFGADYDGKKISFAASIGSTDINYLSKQNFLSEQINKFTHLSVRDPATYDYVKSVLKKDMNVMQVVDPTMLLTREKYESLAPVIDKKGYILFYYFSAIPKNVKNQVEEFAKKTGREIIVMGENLGWADRYVSNDPFLMLSYYKNADFVVTNTFHGNVFSLIFNKQFISFGKEKPKVVSLLDKFGLNARLCDTDSDFISLFDEKIDYEPINKSLDSMRKQSQDFLISAIHKNTEREK